MDKEKQPDYFEFARKTPYPLADYLKVIYDLRSIKKAASQDTSGLAIKRRVIVQLQDLMRQQNLTKTSLAKKMNTSRASLDRLLDPAQSVTLQTLQKAADALGKDLDLHFV
ncbi:MAG: helix-turn-helix domain-containing protein [Proteobacteria bacterium]|nr:helix-turn-helix domain-containing protein [Pseudomonadota bacterium]